MKDIATQILKHENEEVFFAFRTMEANHLLMQGQPNPPHRHDFYTILLVKRACGSHFVDFIEYEMKPRMVFFVSVDQVHQVVVSNNNPMGDILMFSTEFLTRNYISESFISDLGIFSCSTGTPPLDIPVETFPKLVAITAEIKAAFEGDSPFRFDIIAAHLKLFLIECNKFAVKPAEQNTQAIQSGRPIVKKFRELLESNILQWHKVNEYADAMNISPDYLNNVVKSNIGKTAKEMIMQRIILEAKRLGLHTSLTNKEIAYRLGYDDPSHFSKIFKKEAGVSFSDFRIQLGKL